jgi:glucose 1-dehydrogenase
MTLDGKVVLVTGAATGIGKAIAVECGRQGGKVAVNHLAGQEEVASRVVKEIGEGRAISVAADVSKSGDVKRMVQEVLERLGSLTVLVNNAGVEESEPFLEKTEEEWDKVISIDLKGPFLCAQAAAQQMVRKGIHGTIINISSVHEELAFPGYVSYCAAKGGLKMMCRDMALELAPHRINVINVAPGAVATPINRRTLEDPQKKAKLISEIPLGRIASPEEIGQLVAFLASDAAAYMTGTTVFIDGGLMRKTGGL